MARAAEGSAFISDWKARNQRELRAIWEMLCTNRPEEGTERTFRSRPLSRAQAGAVFERWVLEAFRLSGATVHYGYEVAMPTGGAVRQQIDGLVFDAWQGFLVECKFWTDKVDVNPVPLLHVIVDERPAGVLGLFFSAFGYTAPAVESADRLRPLRVLLFDSADLVWALNRRKFAGSMVAMVRRKWMLAVRSGKCALSVAGALDLAGGGGNYEDG